MRPAAVLLALLVLGGLAAPVLADAAAREYFTDVELVDHTGKELRLYSDLLEGRVVVINAMFSDCLSVCPVTSGNLKKIQDWLGPRLGEEVSILSFTVEPEDDPERLARYAREVGARPGWHFLTGRRENLELALRKLGLYAEDRDAHSTIFLVGNVPTGLWKKAMGMASASELIAIVDSVASDRGEDGPTPAR